MQEFLCEFETSLHSECQNRLGYKIDPVSRRKKKKKEFVSVPLNSGVDTRKVKRCR